MFFTIFCNKLFSQLYTVDTSFGNNGVQSIAIYGVSARPKQILMLDDDSFLVGINTDFSGVTERDLYIYKLDNNGNIDLSFGTNGYFHPDFEIINDDVTYLYSMAYNHIDHKIYVLCTILNENKLFRIDANGNLDTSFGVNGYFSLNDSYTNFVIQNDGKIVLAGWEVVSQMVKYKLTRLDIAGNVDTGFGVNGIVIVDPTGYILDIINQIKLQEDGKIITVGASSPSNGVDKAVICRFNTDGSLDTTFGNTGIIITNLGTENTGTFYDVAINSNGDIVAAGHIYYSLGSGFYGDKSVLVKYLENGSLDTSFAGTGIKIFEPFSGVGSLFFAVSITSDNYIIAGGTFDYFPATMSSYYYLTMVDQNGTLNPDFFGTGFYYTDFNNSDTSCVFDIVENSNGDIISTGRSSGRTPDQTKICKMIRNSLSTDDYDNNDIKFYPNPFTNKIFINRNDTIKRLRIYSLTGRVLYDISMPDLSNGLTLNADLPPGVYTIETIDVNNRRIVKKMIKQ